MTRQPPEQEQRRKLVRVAATEDRQEAEAWFQALKQAGIPARVAVREDGAGGAPPRLLLYVLEEDRERAAAALAGPAPPAQQEAPAVPPEAAVPAALNGDAPAEAASDVPAAAPAEPPAAPGLEEAPAPAALTFATVSGWLGLAFLVASVILIILSMQ
ncbi:MAG TPA: hypothetical protein VIO14_11840 [Dehalococcoidia bacterium]